MIQVFRDNLPAEISVGILILQQDYPSFPGIHSSSNDIAIPGSNYRADFPHLFKCFQQDFDFVKNIFPGIQPVDLVKCLLVF